MRWCLSTPGQPNTYSPSLYPPPLSQYPGTPAIVALRCTWRPWSSVFGDSFGEREIEWTQQCTWRPWYSEYGDALGDWEIRWTQRCTWRPWLSEFGDALGDRDRVNSVMHLDAVIERVGRYTWRLWSIKIGGVLGGGWSGGNWSEGGWFGGNWSEGGQSGGSQSADSESEGSESGGGQSGGMWDGSWDSIHWLTRNCENWVQQGPLRAGREWLGAGDSRWWDNAVRGLYSTRCMLYSVSTLDYGLET